jgi:hypothetical protein
MKRLLLPVLFLLVPYLARTQDVSGFLDYRDHFFVFDAGAFTELEPLAPRAFASGAGLLMYASSNGDLKVYKNGKVTTIDQNISTIPTITDNYIGYATAGVLKLYHHDSLHVLSRRVGTFLVEDSVAAFYDEVQRTLSIHYRGATIQAEDALLENPVQRWSAGDNTIAWVSKMTHELYVFYRGEVWTLGSLITDIPLTAGLDMVAFQDPSDKGLKVFYKGEVIDLEPVMPEAIHMGKGLFAYIDRSGALKVFQNGKVHTALDFTPDEYYVKDSLVVMRDKNQCRIFRDGVTQTALPYWPALWAARWSTFAYLDANGTLGVWSNGTASTVMQREPVRRILLDRGLITITLTNNATRVWWNGQVYTP